MDKKYTTIEIDAIFSGLLIEFASKKYKDGDVHEQDYYITKEDFKYLMDMMKDKIKGITSNQLIKMMDRFDGADVKPPQVH